MILQAKPRIKIISFGIIPNEDIYWILNQRSIVNKLIVEDIESFGMGVGYSVFQTVRWSGKFEREWERFSEEANISQVSKPRFMKRSYIKQMLCYNARAKDSNIRVALIDLWGEVGVKKKPGLIYGVSKDVWSALAIGTTYLKELYPNLEEKLLVLRSGG